MVYRQGVFGLEVFGVQITKQEMKDEEKRFVFF